MKENRVIKAGVAYTVGNYFIKGLNFLTIPIFARLLSTNDYGIYNTFVAYESVLSVLVGGAIHTSYKNAYLKYGDQNENVTDNFETYASNTLVLIIGNTIIWIIIVNLFYSIIARVLLFDRFQLNLLVLYSFSNAVILCFNSRVSLKYQYKNFLKVSFINVVGNIAISIILIETAFKNEKYLGRILGTAIPIFILAIAITFLWISNSKPQKVKYYLKWGIKYSLPIIPHGISQIVLSQFDRIMINFIAGSVQAGIYSFSYNIYSIIAVTYTSIEAVWGQWFYEKMHRKDFEAIKRVSSLYMVIMLFFSLIMIFASPELIILLGTLKYKDSVYCVIPIVAGGYFAYLYTIPCQIEYYHGKTSYIAIATIGAAILNILGNYIFINKHGYIAAAYTTLITYIVYFFFHYFLAWKIQKKCIFSTSIVLGCSITIILGSFISLIFIDAIVLRWILIILFSIAGVVIEEKRLKLVSRFLRK